MNTAALPAQHALTAPAAEEAARADGYALIASLFCAPPDAGLLRMIAQTDFIAADAAAPALADAWRALRQAAALADPAGLKQEFDDLFITAGRAPVLPYASYYLAGFLNEKPLADLRSELARLGLTRQPGRGETEDHVAALCEVMRLMIAGGAGRGPLPLDAQREFFQRHLAPWYARLATDIRAAEPAAFYRRLADFAQAFFDLEAASLEMA